jgi:hypothetical protein
MNIWAKHVDEFVVVAPLVRRNLSVIDVPIISKHAVYSIPSFDLLTVKLFCVLLNFLFCWTYTKPCELQITFICVAQCWVVGLLGSNSFPKTPKSAKYAGNWDPKSKKLGRINCNNGF